MLRYITRRASLPWQPNTSPYASGLRQIARSLSSKKDPLREEYDAIIVGAGHNGLITVSLLGICISMVT